MESLFSGNIVFVFFYGLIAVYNYSNIKEFQKISIVYITVFFLTFLNIIAVEMSISMLVLAMFSFLEILSDDDMKYRILTNPIFKMIDCIYISVSQYNLHLIVLAVFLNHSSLVNFNFWGFSLLKVISVFIMIWSISSTLRQNYTVNTITEMYSVFGNFPINKVEFNSKLKEVSSILVSIEDSNYFERTGYTFLSFDSILKLIHEKILSKKSIKARFKCVGFYSKQLLTNIVSERRGYSTIQMQLIRSIGIKRGYNKVIRRKIFELLYSRMIFKGIEKMYIEDIVANTRYIKDYYIYIYFHSVNTFLNDVMFSKFLNAFDMQYEKKNMIDVYDISNEGVFIACMGLSKRTTRIIDNIDYYIDKVEGVDLDRAEVLNMVSNMMNKPYNGNYLK